MKHNHSTFTHTPDRNVWLVCFILLLTLALTGCATAAFQLESVDTHPVVKVTPWHGSDQPGSREGVAIQFDGFVDQALYDPASRLLFVRYTRVEGGRKQRRFASYDLQTETVRWAGQGNPHVNLFHDGVVVLDRGSQSRLFDAQTGSILRQTDPYLFLTGSGDALVLSPQKFARIDLRTGEELWNRPGSEWHGSRWESRVGDRMFVVADGLHSFDMETGEGWSLAASTHRTAWGKAIAIGAAQVLLAALGGGYVGTTSAQVTHNLASFPEVIGEQVFFAARDRFFCLDASSGVLVWEADLGREVGVMEVHDWSETEVALVGTGWRFVDGVMRPAAQPSVTLFDKESGTKVAQLEIDREDVVMGVMTRGARHFVMTGMELMRLEKGLGVQASLEVQPEFGRFVRLMSYDEVLAVRTTLGVLVLDPSSLDVSRFIAIGEFPLAQRTQPTDWRYPLHFHSAETKMAWWEGPLYWTPGQDGLVAIDLKRMEKVDSVLVTGGTYEVNGRGDLVATKEDAVILLSLTGEGRPGLALDR